MGRVCVGKPEKGQRPAEIKFDLPEASSVSLIIKDVLGRQVTELASGFHEAGYHSVTWNASNKASSEYFARFNATDATGNVKYMKINKFVLMKYRKQHSTSTCP